MSELTFCKQFLSAMDNRPLKLSSDHIADARNYPAGAFILPRLPHRQHPARPTPKPSATQIASETPSNPTLSITLKPTKPTAPTVPLPAIIPAQTSIYDLKTAYATSTSIPSSKIKILYKKKPVPDSKTVAEVIGPDADAGSDVEFSVMVMGGATAGSTPVASPPAVAPSEAEKGLAGATGAGPAAQGPSGKSVVDTAEFWDDLKGFMVQRIRDEAEAERLHGIFRGAWERS
ncbi:hypothetical protein P154DRAFT_426787 [Amniculicola lignicola CBS 123094]|uniref:Ubiquitin-like domain-containing protein n=1 Tax=Amniculicola lignicola CBS 123094 TaxID=1392246 RepID=A0A6A5WTX1_9PLEO|nr:hypothetical protein P154DRAFT_426787 [Amniculicola lignicola CBS 123094]